uniref:Uncharacterized protein n=1 Tax=Arundo donax TaxID=35708 RepID=A0A0A9BD70_ARUDO
MCFKQHGSCAVDVSSCRSDDAVADQMMKMQILLDSAYLIHMICICCHIAI